MTLPRPTPELLADARRLADAATAGPWHIGHNPAGRDPVAYFAETYAHGEPGRIWLVCVPYQDKPLDEEALFTAITGNGPTSEANAAFIAAGRTLVPKLCDALVAALAREASTWNRFAVGDETTWPPEGVKVLIRWWNPGDVTVCTRVGDGLHDVLDGDCMASGKQLGDTAEFWRLWSEPGDPSR